MSTNANNVDNRVVNMQFNNQQFEQGVQQTITSLDNLKEALKINTGATSLQTIQTAVNSFSLANIESQVSALTERFSTLGIVGMAAIINITNKIIDYAGNKVSQAYNKILTGGWSRASTVAQARFTLEGIFSDEPEKVAEAFKSASYAVTDTAYTLSAASSAASQLAASGVDTGDQMKQTLQGIAGVAAMTGDSFESISNIFTTVAGNGRLMGMQLTQLSAHGLNAAASIAEVLGTTEENVREMVSKGEISFDTFANAMYLAFGEHAKDANKTFSGVMDNINAQLSKIGEIFSSGIVENDELISFLDKFRLKLGEIKDLIAPLGSTFKTLITAISNLGTVILKSFDVTGISSFVDMVDSAMKSLTSFINEYLGVADKIKEINEEVAEDSNKEVAEAITEYTQAELDMAEAVWRGEYGNGEARKAAIAETELDYDRVQSCVNALSDANFDLSKISVQTGEDAGEAMGAAAEATNDVTEAAEEASASYTGLQAIFEALKTFGDGIHNIYESAINIGKSVYRSFKKVIGVLGIADNIKFFGEVFSKITDIFAITDERAEKLERTFAGIWAVIDIVRSVIQDVVSFLVDTFGPVISAIFDVILSITAAIGDVIVKVHDWLKENKLLKKIFELLSTIITNVIYILGEFFEKLSQSPAVQKIKDAIVELADKIADKLGPYLDKTIDKVKNFFSTLNDSDTSFIDKVVGAINVALENMIDLFDKVSDKIGNVFDWFKKKEDVIEGGAGSVAKVTDNVKGVYKETKKLAKSKDVTSFVDNLSDTFTKLGGGIGGFFGKIFEGFNKLDAKKLALVGISAAIISISGSISYMVVNLGKAISAFGGVGKSISGFFGSLSGVFKSFVDEKKANNRVKVIKAIALMIAVLAASLIALTLVDSDKLRDAAISLSIVLGVIAVMITLFFLMTKTTKHLKKTTNLMKALAMVIIAIAIAVALLVDSLIELSKIDWNKSMIAPVIALVGILAALTGIAILLSKFAPEISRGGLSLALFAAAVWILTKALKNLTEINIDDVSDQMGALLVALIGVSVVALAASQMHFTSALGVIAIVLSIYLIESMLRWVCDNGIRLGEIMANLSSFLVILGFLALIIILMKKVNDACENTDPAKVGKAILKIALAMLVMTLVVKLLGRMPLLDAIQGIALMAVMIIGIILLLNTLKGALDTAVNGGKALIKISWAMAIMSIIIVVLGSLPAKTVWKGVAVVFVMALIAAGLIAVSHLAGSINPAAIWAMIAAIAVMSLIIAMFAKMEDKLSLFQGVGALGLAMLGMAVSMYLISLTAEKIKWSTLLVMVGMVAVIAGGLYLLVDKPWKQMLVAALAMTGVLLAIGICFKMYMSAFEKSNGGGLSMSKNRMIMMLELIALVAVVATSLALLVTAVGTNYGGLVASALGIIAVIAAVMGAMVGINKLANKKVNTRVLIELGMMIAAIIGIAFALRLLLTSGANWSSYIAPTLAIVAVMAAMMGVMIAVNKLANRIKVTTIVALGIMIAGLLVAAMSLKQLLDGGYNWGRMVSAAASMAIVLLAVSGSLAILTAISKSGIGIAAVLVSAIAMVAVLSVLSFALPGIAVGIEALAAALERLNKIGFLTIIGLIIKMVLVFAALAIGSVILSVALLVLALGVAALGVALLVVVAAVLVFTLCIKSISKSAKTIAVAIGLMAKNINDLGDAFLQTSAQMKQGMVNLAVGLASAIISFVATLADNAETFRASVLTIIEVITDCIRTGIQSFISLIVNGIKDLLTTVDNNLPDIVERIVSIMATLASYAPTFGYYGGLIITGLIVGILNALAENAPNMILAIFNLAIKLVKAVGAALSTIGPKVVDACWDFTLELSEALYGLLAEVDDSFEDDYQAVVEEREQRAQEAQEDMANELNSIFGEDSGLTFDVGSNSFVSNTDGAADNDSGSYLDKLKGDLQDGVSGLSGSFSVDSLISDDSMDKSASDTADTLTKKYTEKIAEADLDTNQIRQMMADGWVETFDEYGAKYLTKEVEKTMTDATEIATGGLVDTETLYTDLDAVIQTCHVKGDTAGCDFLRGLGDGLNNKERLDYVRTSARDVGQMILDEVRSPEALDESSPSHAGYKIGGFFDIGLANGIKALASLPANEAGTMGKNIVASVNKLTDGISSNMDFNPVITPVIDMSNVEDAEAYMSDTLQVGELATDAAISFDNTNTNAALATQIEALSTQINKLADTDYSKVLEGVNVNVDASTKVDGTVLRKTASKYTINQIDRQERAYILAAGGRV